MGKERGERTPLPQRRHQSCILATIQTCTVLFMRMSVSPFIRSRGESGGTKDHLNNIQPLPLYPVQTSPLERGVEWPRRSVNTTLSRTSASRGAVLSGSYIHRGTASKWRFPSGSSSIQSLLTRHLALVSLPSSFPNPRFSIWKT